MQGKPSLNHAHASFKNVVLQWFAQVLEPSRPFSFFKSNFGNFWFLTETV